MTRRAIPSTRRKAWHRADDRWEWKGYLYKDSGPRPRWSRLVEKHISKDGCFNIRAPKLTRKTTPGERKASLRRIITPRSRVGKGEGR